jgi:hypothetical protein
MPGWPAVGKGARAAKRRARERDGSYQEYALGLWQEQDRQRRETLDLADRWMERNGGTLLPEGVDTGTLGAEVIRRMADEQRAWEASSESKPE